MASIKRFYLSFDMENAAFYDDTPEEEVAFVLDSVSRRVKAGFENGSIRDSNGNMIGAWSIRQEHVR